MKPERIGKYEIVGKLGQGAMGEVFLAKDPVLNRQVAIKRISAGLDADDSVRKRFQREAQSVAQLSHPNIIKVYELGIDSDQFFMAMELLDGVDLKQAMAQGKLTLDGRVDVIEQMLEGLAFAHANGIVHRDLKPANIHLLTTPKGIKVKLMDFGLAKVSGSDMTSTGTVMGTPHYMSPEQVRGHKADSRSDIFAVGCVFYELLSGRKPFDAESMHAVLFKVIQEEPPPLAEVAPTVPAALVQVVERAIVKDPAERFQNAAEMLGAVRRARQAVASGLGHEPLDEVDLPQHAGRPLARGTERAGASHSARRSVPPRVAAAKPSHTGLWIGLALGLVLVLAVGAFALRTFLQAGPAVSTPAPEVQGLARAASDGEVDVALRRLDAGDLEEAARRAARALKFDPQNAAASRLLEETKAAMARVEKASAALRAAGQNPEAQAAAAFELMRANPASTEAAKAAAGAGTAFRSRAEEAGRLARDARRAAEQAGADHTTAFTSAAELQRQAEQAQQGGDLPAAARRFLEAQRLFVRARANR